LRHSTPGRYLKLQDKLKKDGILKNDEKDDQRLRFTQDCWFTSPTAATAIVLGGANGALDEWKDDKGRSLRNLPEE